MRFCMASPRAMLWSHAVQAKAPATTASGVKLVNGEPCHGYTATPAFAPKMGVLELVLQ